jgi:hypothetical protein
MKLMRWVVLSLLAAALAGAVVGWKNVGRLRVENTALRAELETLKAQEAATIDAENHQREQELQRLRADAQEVVRLRGEVAQLRGGAKETDRLRAENQRLQSENRQLSASAAGPSPAPPAANVSPDQFPKESWAFSGYASPEAALVSAIWAMKQGDPKAYAASLSPEEQARMAQTWANKSEADIAAKHQKDVSVITGVRILDRQAISPEETQMNVYIEGVGRMDKVSMKRIGEEWRFGGFIRNPVK